MQFWLCCSATVALTSLLPAFLMLPPLFSIEQALWLACLIIPMLSVSLTATPIDPTIMQRATGKNQCTVNGEVRNGVSIWIFFFSRIYDG